MNYKLVTIIEIRLTFFDRGVNLQDERSQNHLSNLDVPWTVQVS